MFIPTDPLEAMLLGFICFWLLAGVALRMSSLFRRARRADTDRIPWVRSPPLAAVKHSEMPSATGSLHEPPSPDPLH